MTARKKKQKLLKITQVRSQIGCQGHHEVEA